MPIPPDTRAPGDDHHVDDHNAISDVLTAQAAAIPALAGDLGGTVSSPQVTGTHLAAPLPLAQGGTGGAARNWAGLLTPTAVKTSAYAAATGDFVPCDTTSGGFTVTLPSAPADLAVVGVKQVIQGTGKLVTVACGGSDVFNKTGGGTTATLSLTAHGQVYQYKASTGIWYITADDLPLAQIDLRDGAYYLDSYSGTDDAKMTSAIAAVVAAGGGTIILAPRAHTFANQWTTSWVSSTVTTGIRVTGAGIAFNGRWSAPSAATTCTFTYSGGGAACMDFQHLGSIELAGIQFKSANAGVPLFQTTNATPNIHDCVFSGGGSGVTCVTDAIVLGGTGTTVGAGDTAPYQGYQGTIYRNLFDGIRRAVLFQTFANSLEIHENTVSSTCGSGLQLGGCIEFNNPTANASAGNHIWGNCVEMSNYPCFVRGTSGCSLNVLGPNGLFDTTSKTIAYYVFLPNAVAGNFYNQVYDGLRTDTFPLVLDGTGTAAYSTFHQSQWSAFPPQGFQLFGSIVSFPFAPQVYFRDLAGDAAMIYPVKDAAGAGGYATINLASANCTQVSDAQTYTGSNWVVSATAVFASGDLFVTLAGVAAGIPNTAYIEKTVTAATAVPWFASGTYALGDVTRPATANAHLYQCTTAGTAGASQPTFPTGGGTVTDGTVVWTDMGAATAAYISSPSTATASAATITWGRLATTNTLLQVKRFHLLTQGGAPSTAADAGAGTSPTGISTTGTDHAFVVSITTGGSGTTTGAMFHAVPAQAWTGTPKFTMTAGNSATATLMAGGYWLTVSGGTVTANFTNAPVASTAYVFSFVALV